MFNGDIVKQLRKERQISTNDLAQHTGISRSYVSMIEAGKRQPNAEYQMKIADFFNVPLEKLLNLESVGTIQLKDPMNDFSFSDENNNELELEITNSNYDVGTLPTYIVFGMIHGVLKQVRLLMVSEKFSLLYKSITGNMLLSIASNKGTTSFRITQSQEFISLQLFLIADIQPWIEVIAQYCVKPDVILQSHSFKKPESPRLEFIWFTEYTSLYLQSLQCRKWNLEHKLIQIQNQRLNELYNSLSSSQTSFLL